ncbi:MLO-like protein [Actinidia chinensis var. chinensis]|uniref:MLO-like protein n=1 Tax=Actinidia chinensis var. chinensis TaxID=1590841 RepID=A0A2R6PF13_ACTCC|nr:MLO-like protein [Actinidia chinensis var. chinensis]
MAGGGGGRSLEVTPTWAVAVVCFVLVAVSIVIEHIIHLIGQWLKRKHKRALYEALEKIKSELMLLGFISLLLTVGQGPISDICISKSVGATWHPCSKSKENETSSYDEEEEDHRRRLLAAGGSYRRVLAAAGTDKCAAKNKVPLVSADGIHQLHIFIFVLAVFHVLYCILTLALGRAKMRRWKAWEKETRTVEYQFSHDPERFRFARETSFGRRHLSVWTKKPILMWTVCFFRQFVRSVPKVDYLTLRHGFIMAHLAPSTHSNFDFQKYIKRSLEEDFKVVVGISPPIWFFAVLFLIFNTNGWYSYLWLPFIPLFIILLVGTKLQVIITKMGLRIQEKGEVVKGVPVVQPGDDLFWFNRPRLILCLINFVLFQNAFQLAFFAWTWYEFGLKSCFHERLEDVIIRISMGVLVQILCSYVTLPLYALVTQMGSTMKPTIFNERIATALKNWHHTAKKHIKQSHHRSGNVTSMSTPSLHASPVHLLGRYRSDMDDSLQASPARFSNFEIDHPQSGEYTEGGSLSLSLSPSPSPHPQQGGSPPKHHRIEIGHVEGDGVVENHEPSSSTVAQISESNEVVEQHEIEIGIGPKEFSFDRRESL